MALENLARDPQVQHLLQQEAERQQRTINLIAAENYASRAVLEATGSLLTNKYAEGYPQRRYYAGCKIVDEVEALAIERAKKLFSAEHANVQPHSGAQANLAAYLAILSPGDTVMGMSLAHGGHLTHGSPVNFSGRLFHFVSYGVNRESETLDYQEIASLAQQHRPKVLIAGASAYPRTIDFARLRAIADDAGALLLVAMAHLAGVDPGGASGARHCRQGRGLPGGHGAPVRPVPAPGGGERPDPGPRASGPGAADCLGGHRYSPAPGGPHPPGDNRAGGGGSPGAGGDSGQPQCHPL